MSVVNAFDNLVNASHLLKPRLFGRMPKPTAVAEATGTIRSSMAQIQTTYPRLSGSLAQAVRSLDNAPQDVAAIHRARMEAIEGAAQLKSDPAVANALWKRELAEWADEADDAL